MIIRVEREIRKIFRSLGGTSNNIIRTVDSYPEKIKEEEDKINL